MVIKNFMMTEFLSPVRRTRPVNPTVSVEKES